MNHKVKTMGINSGLFSSGSTRIQSTSRFSSSKTTKNSRTAKKKLDYNFKAISSAILRAKTPASAGQAVIKARQKLGQLLRKARTTECDENELRDALLHIRQMERIARKKKKHLEQEERAGQGQGVAEDSFDLDEREDSDKDISDILMEELSQGLSEEGRERLRNLMQEIEEMEERIYKESMDEVMDGMDFVEVEGKLAPDDLEKLKKKHRAMEYGEVTKADMEYLKSKFHRLEQEKQSVSCSVCLDLSGQPQPVMIPDVPVETEGAAVDVQA